jgi:hypothetical protein
LGRFAAAAAVLMAETRMVRRKRQFFMRKF